MFAMGVHGGYHRGEAAQQLRIVFFHKEVYRMAAGGDDYILDPFFENALIFPLYYGGADGGFLRIRKAQLYKGVTQGIYAYAFKIRNEGWRYAGIYGGVAPKQNGYQLGLVYDILGALRAGNITLAAEHAFIGDDVCLAAGEAYGFHTAVTYTLMTVLSANGDLDQKSKNYLKKKLVTI